MAGKASLRSFLKPQYMRWKTNGGMTWAHPPAAQPAGRLSVVAVSGTCSPDQPGPAVLLALLPPPAGVRAGTSPGCCGKRLTAQTLRPSAQGDSGSAGVAVV